MLKERILITGGTGFIGSHTTEMLEAMAFKGDIREASDWRRNLEGGEIIFLIAGVRTETDTDFDVNAKSIDTLFNVAIESNKLPEKLILASSQAVYMGNETPFEESQEALPTTVYGQSKLSGEKLAQRWCKELGVALVVLRYSVVIGTGVREKSKMSGPLFAWTKAAIAGESIKVFQDGNQRRDYIHIDDVVSANVLAITLPSGIYNVGGGKEVKLIELAVWIKEAASSNSQVVIMGGEPSESDPREMLSDISKLGNFGWSPKMTAKQAVDEFISSIS